MTQQTISQVPFQDIRDPGDIVSGQSQETQIYYRPAKDKDGNDIYIPTTPLPSDTWHMNYYANKGFKLWPPGEEPDAELQAGLQAKVKELESTIAELTGDDKKEGGEEAVSTEVETLEEQAATIRTAIVAKPNAISCAVPSCSKVLKTYLGLQRHMHKIHNIK